ncbi:MAG: complement resistance protein TraT [Desulfovibrionaceae bacterium]
MNKKYLRGMLLLCLCVALSACVQHKSSPLVPTIETLQSEKVRIDITPDAPPRVYVSLRDKTDKVFGVRTLVEQRLTSMGYEITNNPSRAGYILQIDVLVVGLASGQAVRAAVPLGYGAPVDVAGTDSSVLVSDVLLALRNKPQALKKRSHVLRAVSSRSAVASYQMRVATLSDAPTKFGEADLRRYEEALVTLIGDMFPAPAERKP